MTQSYFVANTMCKVMECCKFGQENFKSYIVHASLTWKTGNKSNFAQEKVHCTKCNLINIVSETTKTPKKEGQRCGFILRFLHFLKHLPVWKGRKKLKAVERVENRLEQIENEGEKDWYIHSYMYIIFPLYSFNFFLPLYIYIPGKNFKNDGNQNILLAEFPLILGWFWQFYVVFARASDA